MPLTVSGSLSLPVNCNVSGLECVPGVNWSCRLTLTITGVSSVTSVAYTGSNPAFTVTGSGTIWTMTAVVGENVFDNESLDFVSYDVSFNPTVTTVSTVDDQPPNSTVFGYTPPIPFARPTSVPFTINYVSEGTAAGPGGVPPAVLGVPTVGSAVVTVTFQWDPDVGLGQLETAIEQSRF